MNFVNFISTSKFYKQNECKKSLQCKEAEQSIELQWPKPSKN